MEFITKDRQEVENKLSVLFSHSIISDVRREGDTYIIEWITPEEFYNNSVDSQKDIDGYYNHLLSLLDIDIYAKEVNTANKKKAIRKKK